MSPAKKAPTVPPRPRLEDLPPLLSLPQVAAYLGRSRWWASQRVDDDREVLVLGGGREVRLFREQQQWRCWRVELADAMGEAV